MPDLPFPRVMALPAVGAPAPQFFLTASVSQREISSPALVGRRVVLTFHGPRTADAAKEVGKAIRAKHGDPKKVVSVSVVDLRAMAGLWKKVAEAQIKSTYERMGSKIPEGSEAADYVVICPDWDGSTCKAFGVEEPDRAPGVVVLDALGRVTAAATGPAPQLAATAVKALG